MCTKTSSQMRTSQMTGGCWSLLEISQELAGLCWSLLDALERYLEVAGAYWRFLEALEQVHAYLTFVIHFLSFSHGHLNRAPLGVFFNPSSFS